jgi:hypothetical protein
MIQVDMVGFYFMGQGLANLSSLGSIPGLNAKLEILAHAEYWLGQFLTPRSVLQWKQSRALAEHLLEAVRRGEKAINLDTGEIDEDTVQVIQTLYARFGEALGYDAKNLLVFYVPQEGVYSVSVLCTDAVSALSSTSQSKLPKEGIRDFNEGGRCLACGFNTAAGFNLLRSVERALRVYYKLVTERDADKGHLDWRTCIQQLRKANCADPKVLGVLDQIRALHRNPLMHPEAFLEADEARGIFQIAASAIDAMTRYFP